MKQGEIWDSYLDPVIGNEQGGRRPVLIISGNMMNSLLNNVIVFPLTTKVKRIKGNVVLEPDQANNLKKTSEAITFQIRTISKNRLKKKIGWVTKETVEELKNNLNDILRY